MLTMTKGPKPQPRNLKIVRGTLQPYRDNPDQPKPVIAAPAVPDYLSDFERKIFQQTAELLSNMRVISKADGDALAIYSVTFARWKRLIVEMRDEQDVIETPTGQKRINPKLHEIAKCLDQCHKLLAEFGLTPSARNRVHVQ